MPTNDLPIIMADDEVAEVLRFVRESGGTLWQQPDPQPLPDPVREDLQRLLVLGRKHGVDVTINPSTEEE